MGKVRDEEEEEKPEPDAMPSPASEELSITWFID
jgi:hypothetical protein